MIKLIDIELKKLWDNERERGHKPDMQQLKKTLCESGKHNYKEIDYNHYACEWCNHYLITTEKPLKIYKD